EMLPSFADIILAFLRNGIVYYILLSQLASGSIDLGTFVFYFGAATGFSLWINSVSGQVNDILAMSMNINFIRSFLETKDSFYRGKTQNLPKYINAPTCDIELKNLTFRYPDSEKSIINNINIKIEKGEKIALVGANGTGKTTLAKLICGLYYPKDGDVMLNGASVKGINIDEYYKLLSVVFQDLHLMPITIAQFVSGNGIDIDRQRVADCLEAAGLHDRVKNCLCGIDTTFYKDISEDDPGVELSGGEKQKLLLARALYKNAPILILDEPTAALDPIAESEIYQKFNEFAKEKTAVFISHRLASTRFCDRIFLLENGQIAECGSHGQLMAKKGKYCKMFEIQSHYYKNNLEEDASWAQ
ncbi:MAG: ABC transporter ATP-binding protein/permease, partial [Oscillospiraceae bacterium]|nr:ABC transporter ATP-binding protein/permease [Oscillospiraceae bacterium]